MAHSQLALAWPENYFTARWRGVGDGLGGRRIDHAERCRGSTVEYDPPNAIQLIPKSEPEDLDPLLTRAPLYNDWDEA